MKKRVNITISPMVHNKGLKVAQLYDISFSGLISMLLTKEARKMSKEIKEMEAENLRRFELALDEEDRKHKKSPA